MVEPGHQADALGDTFEQFGVQYLLRLVRRGGLMGFGQTRANVPTDRADQQAEDERDAPAPAFQGRRVEQLAEGKAEAGPYQCRVTLAGGLPADVLATVANRTGLHQEHRRGTHLPARRHALDEAAGHQQQCCEDTDLRIRGRKGDHGSTQGHQPDGQAQGRLAPTPVGVAADDHRPHRTHQEPDAKGGQRHQQRRHRRLGGEEMLAD